MIEPVDVWRGAGLVVSVAAMLWLFCDTIDTFRWVKRMKKRESQKWYTQTKGEWSSQDYMLMGFLEMALCVALFALSYMLYYFIVT